MKKILFSVLFFYFSLSANAADLAHGQNINKTCALCHGLYGQGASGTLSPRIAGLPKEYIIKAIKDYRDGVRNYDLMVRTAGIDKMSDADIEDIAAYLSMIDLSADKRFDVKAAMGDPKKGRKTYRDCRSCHARDGYGKPRKGAPPLAGQHQAYTYTTIENFRAHARIHDNDPEDDSFEDYDQQDLIDVSAYLTTLDDKKIVNGYVFAPPVIVTASKKVTPQKKVGIEITDIKQTVVKMAVKDGVSKQDVIDAMNSVAVEKNMKLVGAQYVSKTLEERGVKTPYLAIFQFCSPLDARTMIMANPIYASYMPCRISMVEDSKGKTWLMMMNLDMLIDNHLIDDKISEIAMKVNQIMLDIMVAGSNGSF